MAFTLYNHQRESSCCASYWSSCEGSHRQRCPAGCSVGENVWQAVFCGQLRALQHMRLRMKQHNKIQQAALLAFAFAATVAVAAAADVLLAYERSSIPYSIIVNQRQCTRSTAGVTQRKDRLPLFQQVFNPKCPRLSRIYLYSAMRACRGWVHLSSYPNAPDACC